MGESQSFHLGDVLSVTTGYLVSPGGIDGVYRVCNFMTGDQLFTHQLPRAGRECTPEILRQHPGLANVQPPEVFRDQAHVWQWLAEQVERYGMWLDLTPLPVGDHTVIDPVAELKMIRPDMPVISVDLNGEEVR